MKNWTKRAFHRHLQGRYSLRLHMFIILFATILSGVLFSKILLVFHVADFRIRYPLSVLLSYLVFFVCIKLWLCLISPSKPGKAKALDWLDIPSSSGHGSGGETVSSFRGGGGKFSGAGTSGSFESHGAAVVETGHLPTSPATHASSASDGIGDVVGEAAGALGDDNVIVAVIVLAVLFATILFSAVYVLYGAPAILSEAAFEGFLAASLIKGTRAMSNQTWAGSIFKTTWKPFAVTVGVALFSGVVLHDYFPKAVRLADILWKG